MIYGFSKILTRTARRNQSPGGNENKNIEKCNRLWKNHKE
jgi:hypothetical protein